MTPEQHILTLEEASLSPVEAAEDWLVAECKRVLGSVFKSIESGPGEWSDAYLKRIVKAVPACRVAFLGGPARAETALTLDTRWMIYLLTGWAGQSERNRRRGGIGSYRAATLLAAWLHTCRVAEVGKCMVMEVSNLWTGEIDRQGLALTAIRLEIVLPVNPPVDADGFREFLTAGVDWNIPEGGDVDASDLVGLRQ